MGGLGLRLDFPAETVLYIHRSWKAYWTYELLIMMQTSLWDGMWIQRPYKRAEPHLPWACRRDRSLLPAVTRPSLKRLHQSAFAKWKRSQKRRVFRQQEMRRGKRPRLLGHPQGGKHRQVEALGLRGTAPCLRGGGGTDGQHFMVEWS